MPIFRDFQFQDDLIYLFSWLVTSRLHRDGGPGEADELDLTEQITGLVRKLTRLPTELR